MKQKQTQAMAGAGEKENAESAMGMKMKKQGHGRTNANQNTKQYTIANEKKQRFKSCFKKSYRRALGREDNCNSDEAPQRRRPTTSTRKQREAADVAEDAPHVDHATEEVFKQHKEAVVDDQGFPGRSCDTSVLTAYGDHVAAIERPKLKLSSHGRKVQKFGRPAAEIEGLVVVIGLSPLIACSLDTSNRELLSAFMERCHKETRSFHLPIGEVTITLDVVASLLHLPIISVFHNFKTLHVDEAVLMLVELLEVSGDEARAEIVQCHGAYCWIYEHFPSIAEAFTDEDYDERSPRAYHWTSMNALPSLTYRKRLDRLTTTEVCWMPYGDHRAVREFDLISCFSGHIQWGSVVVIHQPERVMRQFGYVQTIPPHSLG
ncbi:uncharacterized protein LOC114368212 [Glycine soja]|uniref:uncharacterized protein LOC114368212 n=1 Tax=Glycine soja TaxID=3848 RepID=UPI00103C214D|nr:uncharacterized protein LOC114368212 [Glycine soja]